MTFPIELRKSVPITTLIRDLSTLTTFESIIFTGQKTIKWTNQSFSQERFSPSDWLVFCTAFAQIQTPLSLTSLKMTVGFGGQRCLPQMLQKSPFLKKLQLEDVNSEELNEILRSAGKYCPQLSELTLSKLGGVDQLDLPILENCKEITRLDLRICHAKLEQGLIGWLQKSSFHLQTLVLYHCTDVTEKVLETLSTTSPSLKTLNLSGCPYISGDSLLKVDQLKIERLFLDEIVLSEDDFFKNSKLFSLLTELSLIDCQISNEVVAFLATHCPRLEKLHLRGHPHLSLETIENLIKALGKLQFLDLTGSLLQPEELSKLRQIRQSLKLFTLESFT